MESVADLGFEFTRKKKYLVSIPNLIKEHMNANIPIEGEVGSYQPPQLSMIWCSYNDLCSWCVLALEYVSQDYEFDINNNMKLFGENIPLSAIKTLIRVPYISEMTFTT